MVSAPVWRSANTVATSTGSSVSSGSMPTGFQANDILILTVGTDETVTTISTPSGWTQIGSQLNSGAGTTGNDMALFWKRATGSETAFTVSATGSPLWILASIQAIQGCIQTGNPVDDFDTQAEGVADTSFTLPEVTSTVDNTLVLASVVHGIPNATNFAGAPGGATNVASKTERTDFGTDIGSLGEGGGTACWTGTLATAGVSGGAFTATSGNNTRKCGFIIVLKPQPDPTSSETGTGTEGAASITGTVTGANVADSGTGSDSAAVSVPIAGGNDTGAGTEGAPSLTQVTEYLIHDNFERQDEDPLNISTSGHDWTSA